MDHSFVETMSYGTEIPALRTRRAPVANRLPVRAKVLVIDDLSANRIALEAVLDDSAYELVQAASGYQALELLEEEDFAVVLLDVQMPEMDGYETARKIREIERASLVPIIFLTAHHSPNVLKGYMAGAVDYLSKPIDVDVLKAKINFFVGYFRQSREVQRQADLLVRLEREAKERELEWQKRLSEGRYRRLVEGIHQGIVWSADAETLHFDFVSPHAERITGYAPSEWYSRPGFWMERVHPEDRERMQSFLALVEADPLSNHSIEHRFIGAHGQTKWLQTEVFRVPDETREKKHLHALSVDITTLKETETALRDAVAVRDEFLSIASHELKTPITPLQLQMQSFLTVLENLGNEPLPAAELQQMLEVSDAQVTRLSRLVNQLLDVSRLNSGRLALQKSTTNLSVLLREVLNQLAYQVRISECRLDVSIQDGIVGEWDRTRLEQVIVNLVTNSLKYGEGSPIEVSLERVDRNAILRVRDYGIGIAPDSHERIFRLFERAVSAKHYGGLGLGLYISHQIVDRHGGKISVESEVGRGAIFTIELPLDTREEEMLAGEES